MNSKYSKSLYVVAIAGALLGQAYAGAPGSSPKPDPDPSAVAEAGAIAAAGSVARGGHATGGRSNATGGRSDATGGRSNADATGGAAAARQGQVARGGEGGDGGAGGAGGTGNGSVDVGGDISDYDSKALAVALPGLVAAPAVPGECRIHTRGWGGFSAGATGGTKLDVDCMKKQHCLNLADRLAAWGYVGAAARQLAACDGVTLQSTDQIQRINDIDARSDSSSVDLSEYPKRDEVIERDNRIIDHVLRK